MDRSSLKVYVRAKGKLEDSSIKISKDLHELTLEDPLGKDPAMIFDYVRVFTESSQEEIFEISGRPLVEHVLDGFDALILAYGPSSTGKSYTLVGLEADKGIFYHSVQTMLEESERISSQKDISILVSVLELFGSNIRDLGLSFKDPHAVGIFPTQQLELSEINGRICVPQAWEIPIKNIEEVVGIVQSYNDMRASLEAKLGKYRDKAHTISIVKIKQKYKGTAWDQFSESALYIVELPGSEKPKQRRGQEFSESLNASSSFHSICKCLANLNSVSNHFSEHKITRILENALKNNSMIALFGMINIDKQFNEETIRTLNYLDKCKLTNLHVQFGESSNADLTIKLLQDERAALKDKLKKLEITQDEQLKKIVEALGVENDIDSILQAQPGSKELQKLAAQRDAVTKVDYLIRRNKEIEKRVEENKKVFEKIKKIDFQSQEKHLRQVLEIKDELNRLKDQLEEAKAAHDYNTKSQVETKTFELNEMLTNSQKLLDEKLLIMNKLPKSITASIILPDAQEVKDFGKKETAKEYAYKLNQQEKNNAQHFEWTAKKYEMQLEQREKALQDVWNGFEESKKRKESELEQLKKEFKGMYEVVKAQRRVIDGIQNGDYNQKLGIEFPENIIPEFPTEKEFPLLFSEIKPKSSIHPIVKIKELRQEAKKSQILKNSDVFTDIIELGNKDAQKLVESLRKIYIEGINELEAAQEEHANAKKKLELIQNEVKKANDEKERFRDLYANEIKRKNDLRTYMTNQKIKKTFSLSSRARDF